MIVEKTEIFEKWFLELKDDMARKKINARIGRIESSGFFGDCEPVGDKVFELRIHYGPGYRVYFYQEGDSIVLLLCGGDKGSQKKDIKKAKEMVKC